MFGLVYKYLKGYRAITVLGPVCKCLEALFELIIPMVVADIIDVGIAGGDRGYILAKAGLMAALYVIGFIFSVVCQYLASKAAFGFGTNLRQALYRHINTFSYAEIDRFGTPSLITRLSGDITAVQTALNRFIRLVTRAPFILVGSIIAAFKIDLKMSAIFLVASVLIAAVLYLVMHASVPHYSAAQKKLDEVTLKARENLAGVRVVRAFSRQRQQEQSFETSAKALNRTAVTVGRISALLNPLTYMLINLAIVAVLWWGGKEVYYGGLSQGKIIALVNYLIQILNALMIIATLVVLFTKAAASSKRVNEVLATQSSINDGPGAIPVPSAPRITFDGVAYRYPGDVRESLSGICLTVAAGESLGVIGGTGSGKSTLAALLPRFYDVSAGAVLIDGCDVRDFKLDELRRRIAVVPQHTLLFHGSLRDNILWGREDASDEQIMQALATAQAREFVERLPKGLDTEVSGGGKNFSGGQKQRLAIARSLVSTADIVIFDDSSSALDFATDLKLRQALKREGGRTTILISQRTSSLKGCDKILVLNEGVAVGIGTHEELMLSCPLYREIHLSQGGAA